PYKTLPIEGIRVGPEGERSFVAGVERRIEIGEGLWGHAPEALVGLPRLLPRVLHGRHAGRRGGRVPPPIRGGGLQRKRRGAEVSGVCEEELRDGGGGGGIAGGVLEDGGVVGRAARQGEREHEAEDPWTCTCHAGVATTIENNCQQHRGRAFSLTGSQESSLA